MADEAKRPPRDPKKEKFRGAVFIERDRCKGCAFCAEFCPHGALVMSSDFNAKGYHTPVLERPEQCNGCDLCGLYCPDFAIFALRYHNPEYVAKPRAADAASPDAKSDKEVAP